MNKSYMSQFAAKPLNTADLDKDPYYPLLEGAILRLVPVFMLPGRKKTEAVNLAGRAIAAYEPRHPSDITTIARIISSSFNALEAEAQAASPDLTEAEHARLISRANTLHRTAQQAERLLLQRHRSARPASTPQFDRTMFEEQMNAAYKAALAEEEAPAPTEPPKPQPEAARPTAKTPSQTSLKNLEQRLSEIDSLSREQPTLKPGTIPPFATPQGAIDVRRPQPAFTK
jgi:hypothetical protein